MAKFSPFEHNPQLCVAVSGGADSMALAILSHTWATGEGGKIICLTVDHQLRQESDAEARQVKVWLQSQGIEHHTLLWKRTKPLTGGLQATARDARYHLLSQWCKTHRIKHLLTAHHAQDQLETFMMRLAKGSALKGLQGIQAEVPTDYGRLIRPLLYQRFQQ
jgi:tRNA(Ile)-lysidine synthase